MKTIINGHEIECSVEEFVALTKTTTQKDNNDAWLLNAQKIFGEEKSRPKKHNKSHMAWSRQETNELKKICNEATNYKQRRKRLRRFAREIGRTYHALETRITLLKLARKIKNNKKSDEFKEKQRQTALKIGEIMKKLNPNTNGVERRKQAWLIYKQGGKIKW